MGDTGLAFTAKKPNGNDDKSGQKVLDEIKAMLNTPLLTLLSRHQGSTETYSSVDTQIYIKNVESA
jgi:hypothetical protein